MKNTGSGKLETFIYVILLFAAATLAFPDIFKINFGRDEKISSMLNDTVIRTACGLCFLPLIRMQGFCILNPLQRPFFKSLYISLPCLVIVVNNLPFIALFTQKAYVTEPFPSVLIFAAYCLSIGLFEETVFRGFIFPEILRKAPETKKSIFFSIIISSAIFGIVHFFNLLTGSGFLYVLLQAGYSFLLGIVWSVLLLKTRNLWLCVMLHAIYDFCGLLLPTLGTGSWWDTPTIIITAVLSVAVALYVLFLILSIKQEDVKSMFKNRNTN